jgi:hypothetical protein
MSLLSAETAQWRRKEGENIEMRNPAKWRRSEIIQYFSELTCSFL